MLFSLLLTMLIGQVDYTYSGYFKRVQAGTEIENNLSLRDQNLDKWAVSNLETGDVIHRMGAEIRYGVNFSQFIAGSTHSKYSHSGLVEKQWDKVYVYDVDEKGVRQVPFHAFYAECIAGNICVQRLKDKYDPDGDKREMAAAYCWQEYLQMKPFDYDFALDNRGLYCTELVNKAYISQRILLAQPVKLEDFPGLKSQKITSLVVLNGLKHIHGSSISYNSKIFTVPGLLSSKYLHITFEGRL